MTSLTKKQRDFLAELDKQTPLYIALNKLEITNSVLAKWQLSQEFADQFVNKLVFMNKQADLYIMQQRATAINRLVCLTNCEKEETARKACLDIIELTAPQKTPETNKNIELSPQTAHKILKTLSSCEK